MKENRILFWLLISIGLFLMSSCSSSYYQQIATLESNQVSMDSTGQFIANEDIVSIKYDFWAKSGSVSFWVINNTAEDIYLDLSKSFLIKNGAAYDYYRNRIFKISSSSGVSEGTVASASVGSGLGTSNNGVWNRDVHAYASASKSASASVYVYTTNESGTEYVEQKIVCIPAKSYKYFEEYNVSSTIYRECGFLRYPSKKELTIRKFESDKSPVVLENRLVFVKDSTEVLMNHTFYVSQYQNINYDDAVTNYYLNDCKGNVSQYYRTIHTIAAPNKYYNNY